ncbi:Uncharacterised protein, partial [uncultured Comamonas sp.]
MAKKKTSFRSPSRRLALEPRLLFDGAGAVAAADAIAQDDQHQSTEASQDHNPTLSNNDDDNGNGLAFTSFFAAALDMDLGPTVESIVRQSPSFETTNADSVTFRVTFSEGVTGVTGSSFVIAPGSVSGATIQLVSQVDGAGTQYDVVVSGLSGRGTLNIDLAASSGIISQDGNSRPVTETNPAGGKPDHSYTIDRDINTAYINDLTGGNINGSNIATRDTTGLEFSGKADAGDTVRLYIGNKLLGSAKADGSGNWSLTYTGDPLAEGTHTLVIRSSDAAGNTATATAALIVDTTPPATPSGTADDIIVELNYNEALNEGSVPPASAFTVTGSVSGTVTVRDVIVEGSKIRLILTSTLQQGETVKVSYTGQTATDLVGNAGNTFSNVDLVNNTKDGSAEAAPEITLPTGKNGNGVDADKHQLYSKGDDPKFIFNGNVVLVDGDDDYLESATVTLTGTNNSGDALSILGTLPKGIRAEITKNGDGSVTLKLIGHATKADYATALGQVQFSTTTGFALSNTRTVELVVNDGQKDSVAVTREIRTLEQAFSLNDTTTAYLLNANGDILYGVNLVMGTVEELTTTLGMGNSNALAFSSVDGHLYASKNNGGTYQLVRINADGTVTTVATHNDSTTTNDPDSNTNLISADIDANGIMYLNASNGSKIFRFDTNPASATYNQWLPPLTLSGATTTTRWTDMSVNPKDGMIYAAGSNGAGTARSNLYRIDPTTGEVERLVGTTANNVNANIQLDGGGAVTQSSFPMQYFDKNGYFYFTAGGDKPTIYRMDMTDPDNPGTTAVAPKYNGNLPTTGDAGRIVTIELDYGDARSVTDKNGDTHQYVTTLGDKDGTDVAGGPRHNQLDNTVWLGTEHGYEGDAKATVNADGDESDDGIAKDKNGKFVIPALREGMTEYSITVSVHNDSGKEATLVGWIDFNRDGKFSTDEACTVPIQPGQTSAMLTWQLPAGIVDGSLLSDIQGATTSVDTFARFRITSETDTLGASDPWNQAPTNVNGHDARSYGARMDGEVEDYKITMYGPDNTPPRVTNVEVSDGDTGPRYTPVGEIKVTFSESVKNVDINDFVLMRDGVPVSLPPDTPISQDPDDPAVWYIDLSNVTNPTGDYELIVPNGTSLSADEQGSATIHDDAGNNLAEGGSIKFKIDNTAPLIDLDSGDDTTRDHTASYTANQPDAVSLDNSTTNREATVEEKSDRVTHIDIAVGGLRDGDNELLVFGNITLKANGSDVSTDSDNPTTATVGGVEVVITYAAGKFTLTPVNAGGAENLAGEMSAADAQKVVRDISYKNDAGAGATNGKRTFSFTATDRAGATASPAVATVDVTGGNGSNGPDVPTVEKQVTNTTTPTIVGEAKVPNDGKLEVTVKVDPDDPDTWQTYEWNASTDPGDPLQYNPTENTWTLQIPPGDDIPEGKYSVSAAVTPNGGSPVEDLTDNELIIDLTPPDAPVVPDQSTHDTTPAIHGTADVRDGEKLTVSVTVNGKTYTYTEGTPEGDLYLKRDNNTWTLQLPAEPGAVMTPGQSYEVTATVKDAAGNISDEGKGTVTIEPVDVTDPVVNEASGHAVFEVTVLPNTNVSLALEEIANSATGGGVDFGTDTGTGLEYWNGAAWVAYSAGAKVAADASGKLLVRTPIINDDVADDGEQFKLIVTPVYGNNEAITDNTGKGTATIKDDGTGDIFDPNTGEKTPTDPGDEGYVPRDNDLTVSSPTVNEGSEYAVFEVEATPGAEITLTVNDGSAKGGADGSTTDGSVDYVTKVEVSTDGGQSWTTYNAGDKVTVPADGTVLVRVPVVDDDVSDSGETFTLEVTQGNGVPVTGTATIVDDGTGDLWVTDPSDPDGELVKNPGPTDPGYKPKDNDLKVSSPTVNEASDYAVFDVQATPNTEITLTLTPGSADGGGTDFGTDGSTPNLEYSTDGGQTWTEYNTGDKVTVPADGKVLVRTPVVNDDIPDDGEQFTLTVQQGSGVPVTGTATIKDDGTGTIWVPSDPANPDGPLTPVTPGEAVPPGVTPPVFDDDRELTVSGGTVNEGSGYGSFVVEGAEGQKVKLELVDGSATVGSDANDKSGATDYTGDLEYFDGTKWQSYTPGEYVEIP